MTVVPTSEPTIRPPRQRRSQDALERVLKAGAELLREEGYEGFTVQEVSRRADVSVGSLYSRITSKDALLLAVYDRELGRINADTVQRITSGDLDELEGRELVTALVEKLAGAMLDNAEMLRVFMQRSTVDPVIWARGSARARQVATAFETILAGHRDKLGHPDPTSPSTSLSGSSSLRSRGASRTGRASSRALGSLRTYLSESSPRPPPGT